MANEFKKKKRVESARKDRDKSTARVENRGVRAVQEEKRREGKEESAGIPNLRKSRMLQSQT